MQSIRSGVDPKKGNPSADFGRGFYTTTVRRQARMWAWKRYLDLPPKRRKADAPVILCFRVPLDRLAHLDSLHFVLGDYAEERFWSLVHHCRRSSRYVVNTHCHPRRRPPDDWYDVVVGPVAAFWRQRVAMVGSDQVSFHTPAAARVLTDVSQSGSPGDFRVFRVRRPRKRRKP